MERSQTDEIVQPSPTPGAPTLKKVVDVKPTYPPEVSLDQVQGAVTLNITVDEHGNVIDAHVLSAKVIHESSASNIDGDRTQDVADAVRAAVLQWKYEPTVVGNEAVPVVIRVTVNFTLK